MHEWTQNLGVRYCPRLVYHKTIEDETIRQWETSRSALFFYSSVNRVLDAKELQINGSVSLKSNILIPLDERTKVKVLAPPHPLAGQSGLFATRKLHANSWILDYNGQVTRGDTENNNYVLHLHDDLSVNAERIGNEARFINDYRGTAERPNVVFLNYVVGDLRFNTILRTGRGIGNLLDEDVPTGPIRVGVFVANDDILPGQELLVSYGKSFWRARKDLD